MRTRQKSYRDYGIGEEEKKKVFQFCQNPSESDRKIIMDAIEYVNPQIAEHLYISLTERKSYQEMFKKSYIPIPEKDFYGYRRKAMWAIYDMMRLCGMVK